MFKAAYHLFIFYNFFVRFSQQFTFIFSSPCSKPNRRRSSSQWNVSSDITEQRPRSFVPSSKIDRAPGIKKTAYSFYGCITKSLISFEERKLKKVNLFVFALVFLRTVLNCISFISFPHVTFSRKSFLCKYVEQCDSFYFIIVVKYCKWIKFFNCIYLLCRKCANFCFSSFSPTWQQSG